MMNDIEYLIYQAKADDATQADRLELGAACVAYLMALHGEYARHGRYGSALVRLERKRAAAVGGICNPLRYLRSDMHEYF